MDVYRPISFEDVNEFRPFRGNIYTTEVRDADGLVEDKDSLGRIKMREVTIDESAKQKKLSPG